MTSDFNKECLNAHSKAKQADPRFVEPDISDEKILEFFTLTIKKKKVY